jgi:tetrahydromethanopterin S-methyltransferase subunit A
MRLNIPEQQAEALRVIYAQLRAAVTAPKCHTCGCLQQTVEALAGTDVGQQQMATLLDEARAVFQPKHYDCLGCPICYPAIAANAFSEAFPEAGVGLDLCPTDEPAERQGWPPLLGDYHVLRYRAPVAICTLNSDTLASRLKDSAPAGLAMVGTLHTENLGIERLIKNTLANSHLRFLMVCGEDTRQAIGHLPGQSLQSIFTHGVDERRRIRGARGQRPVLKNVTLEEIHAFTDQLTLVAMMGETREEVISMQVETCRRHDPGPYQGALTGTSVNIVQAAEPERLTLDPAGYVVIYPDGTRRCLVVEHYTNAGVLNCVLEGKSPAALWTTLIERQLLTRLDHAAYIGRELGRAERSLVAAEPYVQDRAPGEVIPLPMALSCGCSGPSISEADGCEGQMDSP